MATRTGSSQAPLAFRHAALFPAVLALAGSLACAAHQPTTTLSGGPHAWRTTLPDQLDAARKSRAIASFGRRPLQFEAAKGQTDPRVKFVSRGGGHTLFLTATGSVLALSRPDPGRQTREAIVVRMAWKGSNGKADVDGLDLLPGKTHYLRGNDLSRWVRDVPSYAKVRYRNLYPGVDLVYYGNQEQLEYDLIVAPGADPAEIRLAFSGEQALEIDRAGNLVIEAGGERIVQKAPVVYQEVGRARRPVAGSYVKTGTHEVGFRVGSYDAARPLCIDPVLAFSTFLGGSGYDYPTGVAVDLSGSVYVTGYTNSTNFPGTGGRATTDDDVFVAKFSSTGSLVYSTYVGDSNTGDRGRAIAVDASGAAYVTGDTYYPGSGNAFPNVNGFASTNPRVGGAFVFKLNPAGSLLLYATTMANGSTAIGYGIAVDGANRAYVVGHITSGNAFPLWPTSGPNSTLIGSGGSYEAFVVKINPAASGLGSLVYATRFGGWDWEAAYGVAVNSAGEAFVTGYTTSYDFPTAGTPLQPTCGSDGNCNTRVEDAFVCRFNAAGTAMQYSTFLGGNKEDIGTAVALDSANDAYVTGVTYSPLFPTTAGAFDSTCGSDGACNSLSDVFVAKLNPTGSALAYSTFLGGNSNETGYGIAVDGAGYAYVAGDVYSMDFPLSANAIQPTKTVNSDAFVTVLNPTGSGLAYSSYLGGSGSVAGGDKAFGIALNTAGDVYVAGLTDSSDFPVTAGAAQATHGGGQFDGFLTKIANAVYQPPAITSATHAVFSVRVAGSFAVTTTGYPPPALSRTGALPGGVTFTDNGNGTATLAGTPVAGSGGTYPLTLTASNGIGANAVQAFTLTVVSGAGKDFNNDGKADILWESSAGWVAAWLMNGTVQVQNLLLYNYPVAVGGWHIVGTGDFNGDGQSDILWQSDSGYVAAWIMNGTTQVFSQLLYDYPVAVGGWHIAAAGDLNGDGISDILWQDNRGYVAYWLMGVNASGLVYQKSNALLDTQPVAAGGWLIAGTGDLNGDGMTDLVWQSPEGFVAAWIMNGLSHVSSTLLYNAPVATDGWTVVGDADMNGDGMVDILWQQRPLSATDTSRGYLATWLMNGTAHAGTALLTPSRITDPTWKIVGPK